MASGDSQYGTPGQLLTTPLQVLVRSIVTKLPQDGVTIVWSVQSGDASIDGTAASVTDSTGSTRARVRLGQAPGPVTVRATVQSQNQAFADFRLFLVERPVLSGIAPSSAAPGESITLSGENFSPDPDQNVVLFSGIRGRVTSASTTSLTVTVPTCLPERDVGVTAQLGSVASETRALSVGPGGVVRTMQVGDVADATNPEGYDCITVAGDGSATYVLMAQSASALGAASYAYTLFGLAAPAPLVAAHPTPLPWLRPLTGLDEGVEVEGARRQESGTPHPQVVLDYRLRELEREATRGGPERWEGEPARIGGPAAAPPTVGERRTFNVYQGPGDFTEVTAEARYVGQSGALFVDLDAPSGGFTQADLELLATRFDDFIHPTVVGRYGGESDLDDNERVVILFTPAVNALTPRGSSGLVGGFFFGIDLLPETTGSNAAEIFYTLVPDPDGVFSDPRSKEDVLELVPGILAHEFQHMVHFNQRVLQLGAEANEAVWLSEGLAQYAEELVARAYEDAGDADGAELFRGGARDRARRYLTGPESVSVVITAGQGTLEERGAGFLHVMYLADRFGDAVVGDLTQTTRLGVDNVEAVTGTRWPGLLSDWWAAIRLDETGAEAGPTEYPSVDLRSFLGSPFPLEPDDLGTGGFTRSGSLPSSAVEYLRTTPAAGGTVTLRIGGVGGGAGAPQARLQLRVIRVQ